MRRAALALQLQVRSQSNDGHFSNVYARAVAFLDQFAWTSMHALARSAESNGVPTLSLILAAI
jgi:hypothetical protein